MLLKEQNLIKKAGNLKHTTPFFYTSKKLIKQNYEKFQGLFENSEVCYAIKANADPRIIHYLASQGSSFEAASFFEIEQALISGVNPERIIYGTSVKPSNHIEMAQKAGISRFAADSNEEIDKLAKHAPGSKLFVRAAVNDADSVFAFSERFGAPPEVVPDMLIRAKNKGLIPYGISFHVGSQASHVEHWSDAIYSIKPAIDKLFKKDISLEVINIGGGFPVKYYNHRQIPELEDIVSLVDSALSALPYKPKIIMEPGRGMIATTTVMVSEVISKTVRRGKIWLVLDGGIYNCLYEAMIHQGTTQYDVHTNRKFNATGREVPCVLAGPTGDSLDIIARDVTLPWSIKVGDRLIFENAGAYTVTMASAFNGFPKPQLYID